MTATKLLAAITVAILLQLALYVLFVLRRRRSGHTAVADGSDAWIGWRDFRVVRRQSENADGTICSFYLKPSDNGSLPAFQPGQYLTFSVRTGPDAKEQVRCYSLSEFGDTGLYRVSIKRAPQNGSQSVQTPVSVFFLDTLKMGESVKVRAPMGRFVLDTSSDSPVALIAGGIGITPLLAMLHWLSANQPERKVALFYGARNSREMAFREHIGTLAEKHPHFSFHLVFESPDPEDHLLPGFRDGRFIDTGLLQKHLPPGDHQFYLCGPNAMMRAMTDGLRQWGVSEKSIHLESFGPSALSGNPAPAASVDSSMAFRIAFPKSGTIATWDGRDANLLEFAERHDISVPSGCRAGNCGSCETKVIEGHVIYNEEPDFPVRPGFCLPCVCRPAGDLALEA